VLRKRIAPQLLAAFGRVDGFDKALAKAIAATERVSDGGVWLPVDVARLDALTAYCEAVKADKDAKGGAATSSRCVQPPRGLLPPLAGEGDREGRREGLISRQERPLPDRWGAVLVARERPPHGLWWSSLPALWVGKTVFIYGEQAEMRGRDGRGLRLQTPPVEPSRCHPAQRDLPPSTRAARSPLAAAPVERDTPETFSYTHVVVDVPAGQRVDAGLSAGFPQGCPPSVHTLSGRFAHVVPRLCTGDRRISSNGVDAGEDRDLA